MQSLPITSSKESRPSITRANQPCFLFLCENQLKIPYLTYQIQDNRLHLKMQFNTLNPHVETISYDEYKNHHSSTDKKCDVHITQDSVGFCQQHKIHLCVTCQQRHIDDYPKEIFLLENTLNPLNYPCKEHSKCTAIFYCEQCQINICSECVCDKHKNHKTLNIKQQITALKVDKVKEDFKTYEENYFHGIDSAYTQAQQELREDYENHKSVNKELFDVVRNVLYMSEMVKESYDFNVFSNVRNIVNNLNVRNLFNYRPGNIDELQKYWKRNLVVNIHNIKDWNSAVVMGLSSMAMDKKRNNNSLIQKNEDINTSEKNTTNEQVQKRVRNAKEFELVTTIQYEDKVWSLCKLKGDLYAAGVGSSPSKIHIVEKSDSTIIRSLTGHSDVIWRWYWHQRSDYLLSLSFDSEIRIWNYSNGILIAILKGHGRVIRDITELEEDNIITVSDDKSIKYWNMNTFKCYKTIESAHGGSITSVLLLNEKQWITGGCDGLWKIWKANANNKEDIIHSIRTGAEIWSWVEVKNTSWLVGLYSGDIWVYKINGFTQVGLLRQHTNCIKIMVLLSDGYLVSSGHDSKIIVWDVDSLSCYQKLDEHRFFILTGWIEVGENEILSGSWDSTIKQWRRK